MNRDGFSSAEEGVVAGSLGGAILQQRRRIGHVVDDDVAADDAVAAVSGSRRLHILALQGRIVDAATRRLLLLILRIDLVVDQLLDLESNEHLPVERQTPQRIPDAHEEVIGVVLVLGTDRQPLLQRLVSLPVHLHAVIIVDRVHERSLPADYLAHFRRRHHLMQTVVVGQQRLAGIAVQVVELRLLVALEDVDLRLDLRPVWRRAHTDRADAVLRQGAANHPGVHLVPQEEQALEPDPLGVVLGAAATVALTPIRLLQLVPKVVAQMFPFRLGDVSWNKKTAAFP